jgi:hypothetical protein
MVLMAIQKRIEITLILIIAHQGMVTTAMTGKDLLRARNQQIRIEDLHVSLPRMILLYQEDPVCQFLNNNSTL